jgi:hypothetical protein
VSIWSQLVLLGARLTSLRCRPRRGTYSDLRRCLFQRGSITQRRCAFTTGSIHLQVRGTLEGRPFNVSLFWFFFTYNAICEQLINILLILFIFKFTNIKVTRVITSAFKSSMKILLFQWSRVSRHLDWRPYIDAWFQRFEVGVNFKFYLFLINYLCT